MSDKYLIVGLGNPGAQYAQTRHNIGFTVVEALAQRAGIVGKQEKQFEAIVGSGRLGTHSVLIAQPLTFMNLSGNAVGKILKYYQIPLEQMLLVYDEAALPFGRIRFRPAGTDAGQKGMRSIIQMLGGRSDLPRLRVGIGSPPAQMAMADYVLARFAPDEQQDLPRVIETTLDGIEAWLNHGTEQAMTLFNGTWAIPERQPLPKPKPFPKTDLPIVAEETPEATQIDLNN